LITTRHPYALQTKRRNIDTFKGVDSTRLPEGAFSAALIGVELKPNRREVTKQSLIVFEVANDVVTVDV
jgi:hypothetical protein